MPACLPACFPGRLLTYLPARSPAHCLAGLPACLLVCRLSNMRACQSSLSCQAQKVSCHCSSVVSMCGMGQASACTRDAEAHCSHRVRTFDRSCPPASGIIADQARLLPPCRTRKLGLLGTLRERASCAPSALLPGAGAASAAVAAAAAPGMCAAFRQPVLALHMPAIPASCGDVRGMCGGCRLARLLASEPMLIRLPDPWWTCEKGTHTHTHSRARCVMLMRARGALASKLSRQRFLSNCSWNATARTAQWPSLRLNLSAWTSC